MVTHVHGAVGVGDESDGYAEAWYLPAANDIPTGYATIGTWYDFFANKAAANFGATCGTWICDIPVSQRKPRLNDLVPRPYAGMTRLNVYAGPAGFYIIRGGPDDVVLDSRTGSAAVLPGPAPKENDKFHRTKPTTKSHRHPGPLIQHGRLSVLSEQSRVFRWHRQAIHPLRLYARGVLSHLEP